MLTKTIFLKTGFIVFISFSISLVAQIPAWKGKIFNEGGQEVVRNPKEPMYPGPIFEIKEDWSIGGAKAEGESVFRDVSSLAVDRRECVYVLDPKECQVKVFDTNGRYVRTIGRKGQGPGEMLYPRSILIHPVTGNLLILDSGKRGILYFDDRGKFIKTVSLQDTIGMSFRVDTRGGFVVLAAVFDPDNPHYLVKKFDAELKRIGELAKLPSRISKNGVVNPLLATPRIDIDIDDRILFNNGLDYEIQIAGVDGKIIGRFGRAYDPVEVTDEDKKPFRNRDNSEVTIKFEAFHAPIQNFFADDRHHVLVKTFEKTTDRKRTLHDVFDKQGRFLGRIPLVDSPVMMKSGKLYSIESDEEGYRLIRRYTATWMMREEKSDVDGGLIGGGFAAANVSFR